MHLNFAERKGKYVTDQQCILLLFLHVQAAGLRVEDGKLNADGSVWMYGSMLADVMSLNESVRPSS